MTFVMLVFLLIPLVVLVLWRQAGGEKELSGIGIDPHPSLTEASGVAAGAGLAGDRVWVFGAAAGPEEILAFYRDPETRPGWRLEDESTISVTLRRGPDRLTISANRSGAETAVIYSLRHETVDRSSR